MVELGQPQVTGLLSDRIDLAGEPYMERFFLEGDAAARAGSVRYHHILVSDRDRHLHDHPWDFTSTILAGRYVESSLSGEREFGPGDVLVRRAEDLHRLTLVDGPVWTHVVTGPTRRRWGFQSDVGWTPWRRYREMQCLSRDWFGLSATPSSNSHGLETAPAPILTPVSANSHPNGSE